MQRRREKAGEDGRRAEEAGEGGRRREKTGEEQRMREREMATLGVAVGHARDRWFVARPSDETQSSCLVGNGDRLGSRHCAHDVSDRHRSAAAGTTAATARVERREITAQRGECIGKLRELFSRIWVVRVESVKEVERIRACTGGRLEGASGSRAVS